MGLLAGWCLQSGEAHNCRMNPEGPGSALDQKGSRWFVLGAQTGPWNSSCGSIPGVQVGWTAGPEGPPGQGGATGSVPTTPGQGDHTSPTSPSRPPKPCPTGPRRPKALLLSCSTLNTFFFLFSPRRVTVREPRHGRARCSPTPRFPSGDLGGLGAEPGRLPRPSKAAREGGGPLGARPRPWAPHQDPAASRSDRHRARVRPGARREP